MRTIVRIGVLLILLIHSIIAFSQKKTDQLDNYFTKLYQNGQFNGAVLVAENGKIIYQESFGYADYPAKKLNTASTSFPVASITKTITSTAILQLYEKGKLQLTDTYIKYFPHFPYDSVTIKQLLSHTSRIPSSAFFRFLDSLRKVKDTFFINKDVIPALIEMKKPLVGEPKPEGDRSNFSYSNVNYYLLGLLIEKLSGFSYNNYLKKYIFLPAGMENSSLSEFYFGTDKNLCKEQRYRYLYSDEPERIDTVSEYAYIFTTYNFKAHGDVVSTTLDLLKYDDALRSGKLLNRTTLMEAFYPVVPGNPTTSGYGLGWSVLHDSTRGKVVFHHGGGIGIETMFVRNITKNQTVILFDNMKNYAFDKAMNALKILNGEFVALPKKSIAKLYGRTMAKEGIAAASTVLESTKKDTLQYYLSEDEINVLGYQFLENSRLDEAHEVLKTNMILFPSSWNSYDSYGEVLLKMGNKEEAVKMYQKSI